MTARPPTHTGIAAAEGEATARAWFRVEVIDMRGQVVAIEPAMLAGRDIGPREERAIIAAIEQLNGFIGAHYVDLTCDNDRLNPCWNGRATDVPGKHWGVGDACPSCCARAALAKVPA